MNWLKKLFGAKASVEAPKAAALKSLEDMTVDELIAENQALAATQRAIKEQRRAIAALIEFKTTGGEQ